MKREMLFGVIAVMLFLAGCTSSRQELKACAAMVNSGFRPVAKERTERFLGKVQEATALCRGGEKAVMFRGTPFVDWANYWATGDASTMYPGTDSVGLHIYPNGRGIDGALLDLDVPAHGADQVQLVRQQRNLQGIPGGARRCGRTRPEGLGHYAAAEG